MNLESVALLRLQVVAEADPAALPRVLERFLNLNVLPPRVSAEFGIRNEETGRCDPVETGAQQRNYGK